MKHKKQPEFELQKQVIAYLEMQYPNVLFISDSFAHAAPTKMQNIRNSLIQKKDFKCPDVLIFEPKNGYHGLFIELKIESPYKKNSLELKKNEHIEAQAESIEKMRKKGYYACFSWSFEMTVKIINDYMKGNV